MQLPKVPQGSGIPMPPVKKPASVERPVKVLTDEDGDVTLIKLLGEQDPTKKTMRNAWPEFIITELQVNYYQQMYDKIEDNGTPMQNTDTYALGMLALNMALVDECNESIQMLGMNMEYRGDRKMVLKRNPALDILKDAQAAVRFYLKEFKMTPTSRGRQLGDGNKPGNQNDGFNEV